ncbi:MAG: hypothetical protein H0X34_03945 [Chthoniobacterales bacterium]|nr:hypothetical protein [Chthoniobacterales bacterium]
MPRTPRTPEKMIELFAVSQRLRIPYWRLVAAVHNRTVQPDAIAGRIYLFKQNTVRRVEIALQATTAEEIASRLFPKTKT